MTGEQLIHGRFRRVAVAGRGSFGRVLEVVDLQSNEARALKIVPRGPHETTLLDEFEQLARLRHPSLPRVFEVGRTTESIDDIDPGAAFFVAEWIAGAHADARSFSTAAIWALLADVAGALATIHAAGLVHADVAPQNLLVTGEHTFLVDLGLAAAAGARGTPLYMAPEAFAGHVEPRSDLYSLGATAIRLLTGHPPFEAATLGELVQRIVVGGAAPALPGIPRPLADLIGRLAHRDIDARPPSALAVLDELDQLASAIDVGTSRRAARPKVGPPPAPASWPGAAPWIEELAHDLGTDRLVVVVGSLASGARQLADAALRRIQLAGVAHGLASVPIIAGELDTIAAQLGVTRVASNTETTRCWIERVARAVRQAHANVVLELGADLRAGDLIAALAREPATEPDGAVISARPISVVAIMDQLSPQLERRRDFTIRIAPELDVGAVGALAETMLRTRPPLAWTQALHAASGGLPLTVVELLRSIVDERDPLAVDWSARVASGVVELRARILRGASAAARKIATVIAVWGGRVRIDRALATARAANPDAAIWFSDIVELERLGLAQRRRTTAFDGEVVDEVVIDRNTCDAALAVAGPAGVTAAADAALACQSPVTVADDDAADGAAAAGVEPGLGIVGRRVISGGASRVELAPVLEHTTLDDSTGDFACDVADELLAAGRGDRALALARRAIEIVPARAGLVAARAAAAVAAYREVPELARTAVDAGADPIEADLVVARAAQRAGTLDDAEATLARLHAAQPAHAEVAGIYARLLVTRSRYADARKIALAGGPLAGLRAEAAGLAAFYLGELADADAAFAALELGATAASDAATIGRALSLRGMVAQQRGQLGLASDRYQDAARRLHEVGELHAAAVAELNLGTVLAERGRASDALPRLAAAARVFADLNATTELIAADLNRGNALLAVGQLQDAHHAAEAALARADGAPHLRAFALLVAGDAKRRLGNEPGALHCYREALAIGVEGGDAHAQISAYVALAEAGHRAAPDGDVEALCASQDDRDRWTVARGRLALRAAHAGFGRDTGSHVSSGGSAAFGRDAQAVPGASGSHVAFRRETGSHAAVGRQSGSHAAIGGAGSHAALGGAGSHAALEESGSHAAVGASNALGGNGSRGASGRDPGSHASGREPGSHASGREPGSHAALGAGSLGAGPRAALGRDSGAHAVLDHSTASGVGAQAASLLADLHGIDFSSLARVCAEVGARATDGDRIERAFRAHAVAARLAVRANELGFARAEAERARAAHAAMLAAAAPAFRSAIEADPDLAQLQAAAPAIAAATIAAPARELPLRRLLTLSRRLNSEASVERILDEVIDTAIELTNAERGFLLLRQADGELAPVVSRNFTNAELGSPPQSTLSGISVSRSIAERAAQTGEPVVTVDAGIDERFGAAASVAALRLRSVLVVPLRQRGTITGCIYVDHRLRGGAFDDVAASVLGELADIAAIAIENARLTADLRRTSAEVDQLNARLSAELADKDVELARVKAELPDRDRLRHRYERIVGRSPATVRMLDVVDRATATSLPVVVVGESGTGKELVARALHDNGPRKDAPFVAINCSAVPETLLESELFGHVRGAFTGADRDRRGLFEVADGGTLFLDEIADTGVAMQAKLLRVLQDGVVRRVGDTKTRQVDVRVIAATQTPLAELVAAGRFREDLRFRVEVIAVPIPALRDRDGDIPLLVERLLQHLCPNKTPPRLTRAAMRALGAHRWPGNIRELENALARGVAMGGDVIDVNDLPEAVANAAGRPEPAKPTLGEDLRLKPALTATEQAYISAAMSRSKGNQTVAARLLGLSRFGLQKKLRRLSGEDSEETDD